MKVRIRIKMKMKMKRGYRPRARQGSTVRWAELRSWSMIDLGGAP